jgi:hypothetical protein
MKISCAITIIIVALTCMSIGVSSAIESNSVLRRRDTNEERHLQTASGVVTKLVLINARTQTAITDLTFGQVVNVAALFGTDLPELNVNAVVEGSVGSVRFDLNAKRGYRNEGAAPYAFCGDTKRKFNVCPELRFGTYNVTATPTTNGIRGSSVKVQFTVISSGAPVHAPVKAPIAVPLPA